MSDMVSVELWDMKILCSHCDGQLLQHVSCVCVRGSNWLATKEHHFTTREAFIAHALLQG